MYGLLVSALGCMRLFPNSGIELLAYGHLAGVSCALVFLLVVIILRRYVGFPLPGDRLRLSALRPVLPYSFRVVVNGLTSRIL